MNTYTHIPQHTLPQHTVPIFVFVFCRSTLSTPHLYKELMWSLCHPDQLHGECGYYLTVFESAIEFVEVEPVDDIPQMVRRTSTNLFPKHGTGGSSAGECV